MQEEQWRVDYNGPDGKFQVIRESWPPLSHPLRGQVFYQFGKLYWVYKVDLARKEMTMREISA